MVLKRVLTADIADNTDEEILFLLTTAIGLPALIPKKSA
jgi:hypothetical protein